MGIATDYEQLRPHRTMLRDTTRTFAFADALSRVITDDSVVLDMGTGSGILAMLAGRLGARKVYAVERTQMAALASRLVADNDLQDTVTVLHADAMTVQVPESVDIIVSEWLGGIGVDENLLPALLSVRDRYLRPGGLMLPGSVTSWVAPAFDRLVADELTYFDSRPYGLDLSRISTLTAHELGYGRHDLTGEHLLCAPEALWTVDVATVPAAAGRAFSARRKFYFPQEQTLNCLIMWFSAALADGVELSCAPDSSTCWGRTVAPFRHPVRVPPGVPLRIELDVEPAGPGWVFTRWRYALGDSVLGEGDNRQALL